MLIPKIAFLILMLVGLVLSLPPAEPTWDTPADIAALAILNDPTPKPVDLSFMPELAQHNITAQTSYICDTTTGSPRVADLRQLATNLRDRFGDAMCRQENLGGSQCTQLLAYGNAGESLCGEPLRWIPCRTAALVGFWIADHCEWNGLVGGRFWFDDSPPSIIAVHKRF
ncbi:hypothetical protein C7212DRAFT_363834 [Tuber magnatum]|uniref:Ecp2 effector protein domain-containing protein n=1 Tax=Tuber magnatum TaxID=42249 RepID=A0A317SMS1_9PEZI|nr:hypothetical protein C7212DRAFT_363834 [Tuber magnatum]